MPSFCQPFDSQNYCPICREADERDDPCVTFISPCEICALFTEEQQTKITHRKDILKGTRNLSKMMRMTIYWVIILLNLLGGLQAELQVAAERLFTSPPHPQPLAFEALKTPAHIVPPTPGTALQQKLETRLEKSLRCRIDIQIYQKMGSFQANMLEAMKSLRVDFQKSKQVEVNQTSTSISKPGLRSPHCLKWESW